MKKTGGIKETPIPDYDNLSQDKKPKHERRMTMTELKVDI